MALWDKVRFLVLRHRKVMYPYRRTGFTLIELLVVIGIIMILLSILTPTLGRVRRQALQLEGISDQRSVNLGANEYASDHRDRYPESIATIGQIDTWWNWQEPMMLTGYRARSPRMYRAMSSYLKSYVESESVFCPSAPEPYSYLAQAWEAGDDWDNPSTPPLEDPVTGIYCYYWNYIGYLDGKRVFRGPMSLDGRRGYSTILSSDYFGYNHWRSPEAWSSCEKMKGAKVTEGTSVSSSYWSVMQETWDPDNGNSRPEVKLNASYIDGHVENWSPNESGIIKVAITADGSYAYPDGAGPGDIYLPAKAFTR